MTAHRVYIVTTEEQDRQLIPNGPMMIELACKNHPHFRWTTKNIRPIGCRKIFFDLANRIPNAMECNCPLEDLYPVED